MIQFFYYMKKGSPRFKIHRNRQVIKWTSNRLLLTKTFFLIPKIYKSLFFSKIYEKNISFPKILDYIFSLKIYKNLCFLNLSKSWISFIFINMLVKSLNLLKLNLFSLNCSNIRVVISIVSMFAKANDGWCIVG